MRRRLAAEEQMTGRQEVRPGLERPIMSHLTWRVGGLFWQPNGQLVIANCDAVARAINSSCCESLQATVASSIHGPDQGQDRKK